MQDLFQNYHDDRAKEEKRYLPLSVRRRPTSLSSYYGQKHLLGEGKLLARSLEKKQFSSSLFFGPPGVGKTTLAEIIAKELGYELFVLNGIKVSLNDLQQLLEKISYLHKEGGKALLFLDEIHRFNKSQQDALLAELESSRVLFIGATTQNPYFALNRALLSRMMLFEFLPLRIEELVDLQYEVLRDNKKGLGGLPLLLEKNVAYALAKQSQGDARQCLQLLEGAALISPYNSEGKIVISEEILKELAQRNQKPARDQKGIRYDRMSSFIKSMRAGDKEGALSCLALLLDEGENLDFILRRLLIFASEDIGLADPQALPLVLAAAQTVERIGLPEARITLTHAVLYLCLAPKNREAYNFSKN